MSTYALAQKLVLGTVQLGLPYGINNFSGKPDQREVELILDKAGEEGVGLLDSAEAYGDALEVIGTYLKARTKSQMAVISKFVGGAGPLKDKVHKTITILGRGTLWAYMYHRFSDYESRAYRKELLALKEDGMIERIGLSVYSNEELASGVEDPDVDVIQVPFNPLDASQHKLDLLARAKDTGKEIHVRSVFLQGLLFKQPEELTGNLKEFANSLREIRKIALVYGVSMQELCLNFALHNGDIDRVVIGVERLEQLDESIRSIRAAFPDGLAGELKSIAGVSGPLLNPSSWKP